jgi:hypothetical protein
MTTAAAINRLVHHSSVLELNDETIRAEEAARAEQAGREATTTTTKPK